MVLKSLKFLFIGILFGIIMYKGQIVSWFRIYEMFRFESFHMYGIIGSAMIIGIFMVLIIKKKNIKSSDGSEINFVPKQKSIIRYLIGGLLFGLGWALSGACPGPMFVLLGTGEYSILIVVASAISGTLVYGLLKDKLPH